MEKDAVLRKDSWGINCLHCHTRVHNLIVWRLMMKWLRFDTKSGTSAATQKQERSFISQTQMKTRMWICAVNSIYLLCIMERLN